MGLDTPKIIQSDIFPIIIIMSQGEGMPTSRKICLRPDHLPRDLTIRIPTVYSLRRRIVDRDREVPMRGIQVTIIPRKVVRIKHSCSIGMANSPNRHALKCIRQRSPFCDRK